MEVKIRSLGTELEEIKADSARSIAHLTGELERAKTAASEAENERKKAETKLVKFQKAWDQLEG
jgi:hypothetical protein